jgi:hypothetical protein
VVRKGRKYRGFVHVNADAVRTKRDLDYWLGLALDYNGTARRKKRNR